MERRFVLFLVLSFAILLGYFALMHRLNPPQPKKPQPGQPATAKAEKEKPPAGAEKEQPKPPAEKPKQPAEAEKPKQPAAVKAAPEPEIPQQWITLGSADPADPYRMLVTLTNQGAAVARIELSSPRYCDIDDRSGYLGHVVMDPSAEGDGCPVDVVGPGTPAAEAGLKPGDLIKAVDDKPVAGAKSLQEILEKTKPNRTVQLLVTRDGKELPLPAKLRRRPLELIRPEQSDPLSLLLTLQQIDGKKIAEEENKEENVEIGRELQGISLRKANWRVTAPDQTHVEFRRALPEQGLEIIKTYRLAKVPEESQADADYPAYNLEFEIEIRNVGGAARKVAYRLDGPNGLPTEGSWYASKVSRNWGGAGLRDFVVSFGDTLVMVGAPSIADGKFDQSRRLDQPDRLLSYIGVDAQYFSAVLMPQRANPADVWFDDLQPIRMGKVDPQHKNLANTSCRLISTTTELKPGGVLAHRFKLFVGPKKPSLLANYGLSELVYYGWPVFAWVAVPLTAILHAFYAVVYNYGLAIILLTVLVRGCMFPLSLKQAAGAQKMQQLQPEIKRIQEKYKKDTEGRTKAQQELFRKHNYNPLAGCLPIFIQMPVFIGLYRALMVDIELRDAPLLSHALRWCSNLAAPDMLFYWKDHVPEFIGGGVGIFGLGPYFNLLPILTIGLFIWQQKMFMPPPADEQAAMQQKIMQYMMIFMGLLFFKVASGLCIYFIASSLWGLAERRFLPKAKPAANGGEVETRAQAKAQARSARAKKK
jgi:YidC/Oxa1 family membrane protein insertase